MPEQEKRHQEKCSAAAEGRAVEGSDSSDDGDRGDKPKTRMPRRKFNWTDDVRYVDCMLYPDQYSKTIEVVVLRGHFGGAEFGKIVSILLIFLARQFLLQNYLQTVNGPFFTG
jgi:hypothetical protein